MAASEVIKEYLLSLGFKVNTNEQRNFDQGLKRTERSALGAGLAITTVATAAVAMATVYQRSMEKLYYASRRTGDSVKTLSAFRNAAEQFGISGDRMEGAIQNIARMMRANPALSQIIGGTLRIDTKGKTPSEILLASLRELKKMPQFMGEKFAQQLLGLSPDDFFDMTQNLDKLEAEIIRQRERQAAAGTDLDQIADAMKNWGNGVRDVKNAFVSLQGILAVELMPMMDWLTKSSKDWLDNIGKGLLSTRGQGFWERTKAVFKATDNAFPIDQTGKGDFLREGGTAQRWLQDLRIAIVDGVRGKGYAAAHGINPLAVYGSAGGKNPSGAAPSPAVARSAGGGTSESRELFAGLEKQYGLPAGLLDSVWAAESARGKSMRSSAGAKGHFQFMPATAAEYGITGQEDNLGVSADAAAAKYAGLLKRYGGDVRKAAAAYNWGEGNFGRVGNNIGRSPDETKAYVDKVAGGLTQNVTIVVKDEDAARRIKQELVTLTGNTGRDLTPAVR